MPYPDDDHGQHLLLDGVDDPVLVAFHLVGFGYYSPGTPAPLPAEQTGPSTTIERPERTGPKEGTLPEVKRPERTMPATTLQSTIPTDQSATASATSTPSP